MKRLRTLQIMWSLGVGGFEVWLRNVMRVLDPAEIGFDFLVFERCERGLEEEMRARGSRIICVSPKDGARFVGPRIALATRLRGPYDVAHCHFVCRFFPLVWTALGGVRSRFLHLRETSFGWPAPSRFEQRYLDWAGRTREGQGATRVLAVSRATAASWYPSVPDSGVFCDVFYSGIPTDGFDIEPDRAELRRSLGLAVDDWVVGHAGRLAEVKNHDMLLEVFAHLAKLNPSARLLLIGDGPRKDELEAAAARLGIGARVVFAGLRHDVPRLLLGAVDHFVFTSHAEGLPNAVLEAQAAGLPVAIADHITTEVAVLPDLVQRLSLRDGPALWAEAIHGTARLHRRDSAGALRRFRQSQFTIEKSAVRLLELYRIASGTAYSRTGELAQPQGAGAPV